MFVCIEYLHHLCHLHHLYQHLTIYLVKHTVSLFYVTKPHYLYVFLHIAERVTKHNYLQASVKQVLLLLINTKLC